MNMPSPSSIESSSPAPNGGDIPNLPGLGRGNVLTIPESPVPVEKPVVPSENEVFRLLGTYWIYQDQIGWSRTQTLVAVEAGVLAGAFAKTGALSVVILILGALLVAYLYRLILRDWQIRDSIGNKLGPILNQYGVDLLPPPSSGLPRGRTLVRHITWGVVFGNLLLATIRLVELSEPYLSTGVTAAARWLLK